MLNLFGEKVELYGTNVDIHTQTWLFKVMGHLERGNVFKNQFESTATSYHSHQISEILLNRVAVELNHRVIVHNY